MDLELEHRVRAAAFAWLDEQVQTPEDLIPATALQYGFPFEGTRVSLKTQQGIHKPRILSAALSLTSGHNSPYNDHFVDESTLAYRYKGTDPNDWTNRAARLAFDHQLPLVYLDAVAKGPVRYLAIYPVFIAKDDQANLAFHLNADSPMLAGGYGNVTGDRVYGDQPADDLSKSYGSRLVKVRLHQAHFRERVLSAYRSQCAICRLKHPKLLDAAHIIPDSQDWGEPMVSNGLSLCKIHHGAFDAHYLSVHPTELKVKMLPSLMEESDGPMLLHGLQELDGVKLQLPRRAADKPDPERLRVHWDEFQSAC
ncbi:MAG: HNH endonuclease [Planctomycetes bacterium]|nr:HNH endonuclease [Planctomycetota bacterium]